ncbi:MAG: lysophospholipid acyltransferase family protein [Candidatus Krumholzibacteria bacterium]|nr:lysophospholipid acyltransferase family protein [Candidatus Krumholzibacteria bacterium]
MKWNEAAEYWAFRGAVGSLSRLPERWSLRLCRRAGWLAGPVLGIRKQVVRRQLAAVYPARTEAEILDLTGRVYAHLGQTVAETFCTEPSRLSARVAVEPGWSALDKAMADGRGVLAVTAHLGNFELGGRILAARYPVLDVVKPLHNSQFDGYLQRQRAGHGIKTVPMDESGRAVLTHLRRGGLVTLLGDQDAGGEGVRTDFLGLPASTWPGAARLALRTGCPVVPLAILRQADGQHVLHIAEPLAVTGLTTATEDVALLTARISRAVEKFIWDRPEQWFWVHRRWKGAAEAKQISRETETKRI